MNAQPAATAKRQSTRTIARQRAADMRRAAKAEAAQRQEARDEAIAPAIQRNAVLDGSGAVLRAPRVERDGVAFIRVAPLAWMAANVKRAEDDGTEALFTREHVKCATRLSQAWEAVGEGVGLGASDWGSLRGSRGTAPVTPAGHSALVAQVAQRIEIEAARTWMGSAWPCLFDIALGGMSPAAWAAKMGKNRQVGAGYLLAALDRLAEYYRARDREHERRAPKMRAVAVAERC
jgi:hypothetical protein